MSTQPALLKSTLSSTGFHKSWTLGGTHVDGSFSFWIQFNCTVSSNGFLRISEVMADLAQKDENGKIQRHFIRKEFDFRSAVLPSEPHGEVSFGPCLWGKTHSKGKIQSGNRQFSWDFQLQPMEKNNAEIHGNRSFDFHALTGTFQFNEKTFPFQSSPAWTSVYEGSHYPKSWYHFVCSDFTENESADTDIRVVFHSQNNAVFRRWGIPTETKLAIKTSQGTFYFSSLRNYFRMKVKKSIQHVEFFAQRGEWTFHGKLDVPAQNFLGFTEEDADEVFLNHYVTQLADFSLWIYKNGKLEQTLVSRTTHYEVGSRNKNPYINLTQ